MRTQITTASNVGKKENHDNTHLNSIHREELNSHYLQPVERGSLAASITFGLKAQGFTF